MNNIKGNTKIELFDTNNNVVQIEKNNLITNVLDEYCQMGLNTICKGLGIGISDTLLISKHHLPKKLIDMIGGIVLFEEELPKEKTYLFHHYDPVAYASSDNGLDNINKGSLNLNETGPFIDATNDIEGYRWVWDFGTSNGNCTFSTICLSDEYSIDNAGSNRLLYRDTSFITNNISTTAYYSYLYINSAIDSDENKRYCVTLLTNDGRTAIYSPREGCLYFCRNIMSRPIEPYEKIREYMRTASFHKYTIEGYTELSYNCYIEDDKIYMIGKKIDNELVYLISISYNELNGISIIDELELSGVTIENYKYFGRLEENYFLFFSSSSSESLTISVYDINTNSTVQDKEQTITGLYISNVLTELQRNYCSVKIDISKSGNKYQTSFFNSWADGESSDFYNVIARISILNLYRLSDEGIDNLKYRYTTPSRSYNHCNSLFINSFILTDTKRAFGINAHIASRRAFVNIYNTNVRHYLWFRRNFPLFTINVMDSPITKTEANTMKITYELTWEKTT